MYVYVSEVRFGGNAYNEGFPYNGLCVEGTLEDMGSRQRSCKLIAEGA